MLACYFNIAISRFITAAMALLRSGLAARPRPPAFAPVAPAPARQETEAAPPRLDLSTQMDRLFAVISECNRIAANAARNHATARAEIDQADYHLTRLVAADPVLQRISSRAQLARPQAALVAVEARPRLRLAA